MDNDSSPPSPHVKIFNLITSAKSFMSYKVTCSQVMGIRIRSLCGGITQPTTEGIDSHILIYFIVQGLLFYPFLLSS